MRCQALLFQAPRLRRVCLEEGPVPLSGHHFGRFHAQLQVVVRVGRGSYSHKYHEEETQGLSQSKENWQEPWPNPGDKADVVGKQKQHMFKAQLMWINLAYRIISFLVTLALSTINVGYHGMGVRCNSGFQTYTWHGAISDPPDPMSALDPSTLVALVDEKKGGISKKK